MKVSSVAIAGLTGFATAQLDKRDGHECSEKTITVTAGAYVASAQPATSTQYTNADKVTSVDYKWLSTQTYLPSAGSFPNPYQPAQQLSAEGPKWTNIIVPMTTAYVWPTAGGPERDAVQAVYQELQVLEVISVHMNVEQHSVISTKSDIPTWTPSVPPPPAQTPAAPNQHAVPHLPQGKTIPVELRADMVDGKTIVRYVPDRVDAAVGDVILFKHKRAAHSATQSSFDTPCTALKNDAGENLFDTDLVPNMENLDGAQFERTFVVYDTAPQWFYCKQRNANHCGQGMVFSINPGDKMDQFIQNAKNQNGALVTIPPPAATPSPTSAPAENASPTVVQPGAATATVIVEGGIQPDGSGSTLQFNPPLLNNMRRGDTIVFDFRARNHTLTQSTLEEPCKKKAGEGVIDTNFAFANAEGTPGLRTFPLVLDNEETKYFYCKQANGAVNGHCKAGMVFAINIDQLKFDQFVNNARSTVVSAKFR